MHGFWATCDVRLSFDCDENHLEERWLRREFYGLFLFKKSISGYRKTKMEAGHRVGGFGVV